MDTEAQATRWLIRLDAARSPELIEEHAKWMAESTRNRVAYMRAVSRVEADGRAPTYASAGPARRGRSRSSETPR